MLSIELKDSTNNEVAFVLNQLKEADPNLKVVEVHDDEHGMGITSVLSTSLCGYIDMDVATGYHHLHILKNDGNFISKKGVCCIGLHLVLTIYHLD